MVGFIDFCNSNIDVPETIISVDTTFRAGRASASNCRVVVILDVEPPPLALGETKKTCTSAVISSVSMGSRSLTTCTNDADPNPNPALVHKHPKQWRDPTRMSFRVTWPTRPCMKPGDDEFRIVVGCTSVGDDDDDNDDDGLDLQMYRKKRLITAPPSS